MANTTEYLFNQESEFDKLCKGKALEGWSFIAREGLTQTKFSNDAKFEEVPFQTEKSLKEKYQKIAKGQDPSSDFEVDLVLDENTDKIKRLRSVLDSDEYCRIVNNLNVGDKFYFVFMRRIKKVYNSG